MRSHAWASRSRVLVACTALVTSGTLVLGAAAATTASKVTVGGWGGIVDKATLDYYGKPFQAATGTGTQFVDAPGTQFARLEAQNKAGRIQWDLLDSVDAGSAYSAAAKGYLVKLTAQTRAQFSRVLGPTKVTPWGFSHGGVANVIVCNTEMMTTCPKNMAEFYDTTKFPQDRMFGGIEPIEMITTAEVALGTPISRTATLTPPLNRIFAKLESLKSNIKVFFTSGDQQVQVMTGGEVPLAIMWSNRAYQAIGQGAPLKVVWTTAVAEPSYFAAVKDGPAGAATALSYLTSIVNNPRAQANWAKLVQSSVPNPKAYRFIPKATRVQLADYPPNARKQATPNFAWYAKNSTQLNRRWQDFVRG